MYIVTNWNMKYRKKEMLVAENAGISFFGGRICFFEVVPKILE